MANQGTAKKFTLCGLGSQSVVISGALLDDILTRLNVLSSPIINPTQNCVTATIDGGQTLWDFSRLDQRISNLEAGGGGGSQPYANYTVSCVGNVVSVAFSP
jgi:hypothetical protein